MGTITIVNTSTLTDGAAAMQVGAYMQGNKALAEKSGIHIEKIGTSVYERVKFRVTGVYAEGAHEKKERS